MRLDRWAASMAWIALMGTVLTAQGAVLSLTMAMEEASLFGGAVFTPAWMSFRDGGPDPFGLSATGREALALLTDGRDPAELAGPLSNLGSAGWESAAAVLPQIGGGRRMGMIAPSISLPPKNGEFPYASMGRPGNNDSSGGLAVELERRGEAPVGSGLVQPGQPGWARPGSVGVTDLPALGSADLDAVETAMGSNGFGTLAVPEPSTGGLMLLGIPLAMVYRRRTTSNRK